MSLKNILSNLRTTLQTEALPGKAMVPNSAGGFVFAVDAWQRLDRFLVLGVDGGSYYASARALTKDNAAAVATCIQLDGARTVRRIVEVSEAGRAPKNDPAIFALAMAMKTGDVETRRRAAEAMPRVCRTATMLFAFVDAVKLFGGFGRVTDRAIERWYLERNDDELALQLAKYQRRNGWSHRDLLRKAKPVPRTATQKELLAWAVGKPANIVSSSLLQGVEAAKVASSSAEVAQLVVKHRLPRECVPTEHLGERGVWLALLEAGMPLTALVRNLGKLTAVGALAPLSSTTQQVVGRLGDVRELKAARLHPLAILVAQRVYASGHGDKGALTWTPVPEIVSALERAFRLAFSVVEPTGKRFLLGLDVSGSMGGGRVAGSPLTPREAAAAMALVLASTEQRTVTTAFTSAGSKVFSPSNNPIAMLPLTSSQTLSEVLAMTNGLPFGATDCALPMRYALEQGLEVDCFVVLTDNETWAGDMHPVKALQAYRQKTGIAARLVVVGMVSNGFTIADPADSGMLDVVGFDTATPALISSFARGEL
jgi:60 kDa SS-A/Ro ribonucleoprotein